MFPASERADKMLLGRMFATPTPTASDRRNSLSGQAPHAPVRYSTGEPHALPAGDRPGVRAQPKGAARRHGPLRTVRDRFPARAMDEPSSHR